MELSIKETKQIFSVLICLVVVLFLSSSTLYADVPDRDLFNDARDSQARLDSVDPSIVMRQRVVDVNLEAISDKFEAVYLNLFDDFYVTAVRDHVETDAFSGVAWLGSIDGIEDSKVTLVVDEGKLSGIITLPDICYHIRPLEKGVHVIREIDPGALEDTVAFPELVGQTELRVLDSHDVLEDTQILRERAAVESPGGFVSQEQSVFNLVNQERAIQGLHGLSADSRLTNSARAHSRDMSRQNYFSHTSLDGRNPGARISAAGYSWNAYGENIAAGYTTPEAVMNGWMNSPGHRANILGESFCDLGIGYEAAGNYWTQNFARKSGVSQCASAPVPNPPTPSTGEPKQPPVEPPTPPVNEPAPSPTKPDDPPVEEPPPAPVEPRAPAEPPKPANPAMPKGKPMSKGKPAQPVADPGDSAPPSKPKRFRNFKRFKKFGKFRRYNFGKFKRYRFGKGKRYRRVRGWRYWRYRKARKRS